MLDYKICEKFKIGEIASIKTYGSGHINDTFLVETKNKKYIIQSINRKVFQNPIKLMKNIYLVTKWMENECSNNCYEGLKIIKTRNNKIYYKYLKKYYRCYQFIDSDIVNENSVHIAYQMGKGLGKFNLSLSNFPVHKIYPVIPDFHNSLKRYEKFKKIVFNDKLDLKVKAYKEIRFISKRKKYFHILIDAINNKKINMQIIHNDPKPNNMIINKQNDVCMIDLDTLMLGTILYDYGDAIRFIMFENEEDDLNVKMNIEKFIAFTKGYIEEYINLTPYEKELFVTSIIIMTLECAMRFLTDYLEGNVYFKVDDPEHNLRRAKVLIKEVEYLEKNKDLLEKIVDCL